MFRRRRNPKNLGKVKRYNRMFYTRQQVTMKVISWAAAILLLFGVGYLVGPVIIDFGTHTWYTRVKGLDLDKPSKKDDNAPQSAPEPTPEPTPAPTPVPEMVKGDWVFASLSALSGPEKISSAVNQYAAQGAVYVSVPLKDSRGYLYYNSMLENASKSVAATTIDAAAVAQAIREAGIIPVAAVCAFQDPLSPYADRSMGIHYRDSEFYWLDAAREAGGKPWLDPWSESAVAYIDGVIAEVQEMGYETVLLSGVQYPDRNGANCSYAGGGSAAASRLAALLDRWEKAFEEAECTLWVQYPLATVASTEAVRSLGGTFAQLGVENLLISLPAERDDDVNETLEAACAAAEKAGVSDIVVKDQDKAAFRG